MTMAPESVTRSTCPYCGVGCQMDLHVRDGLIYRVEAPFDAAPNYGNLCVKGRFGLDFATHPRRLRKPLIRNGGPGEFREASWDEALALVSERLAAIVAESGGDSIATYACAKASNEDNFVFQKWVRAVLGTNNVDHCARLCHAGSVTGLQLAIGSSAMSNSIGEMEHLDTFIVTGSNTTETHPVISLFLKKAVRQNNAKLIVIDPRQIELTDFATLWLRQEPGSDVAVFQAMAHVIVSEQRYNADFIAARTEDFDDYVESLESFTPEWAESVSGVPAEDIRTAARMYADAERAAFYWGMGISQSTHGTDNALALTNLALMTGHIGKPGTGLNPLRGQNNVQGCSDSGGLPTVYTAYQRVDDPEIRGRFERAWDVRSAAGAWAHGHRDGRWRADRPDPRHGRHGRKSADERAQSQPRAARHGSARLRRLHRHLHERDRRAGGRDPAFSQLRREGRHLHQQRPARAARASGLAGAGRIARGLADHLRAGAAYAASSGQVVQRF